MDSITVMTYFANLIYKKDDTYDLLYEDTTPLYSLNNMPHGSILLLAEHYLPKITDVETPPMYDLVAAHAVLYGSIPTKEEVMSFYQ